MHVDELLEPRIHVICGKGGVGRTTVSAALALVAARHGRKVCVAEVDHRGSLPALFGAGQPSYEPSELSPGVWALNILPEDALAEYLKVQYHMRRISRVLTSSHFVDYITTAAPGLQDILVLGKIWYLEQNRTPSGRSYDFDVIIVDAPASGHMLSFLSAPAGLADAVQVGPIRRQSEWLVQMLTDPRRTKAHLVTIAEEIPVQETLETHEALRRRLRMSQGPLFINGLYAPLDGKKAVFDEAELAQMTKEAKAVGLRLDDEDVGAMTGYARFLEARRAIQSRHLRTLRKGVELPLIELPYIFSGGLALPDIEVLSDAMEDRLERS